MSNIAPAYITVNPSYTMPELLFPYFQASGAFDLLPTGEPLVRLSEGDQAVYINRLDIRTRVSAGQSAFNELPSVGVAFSQISTATYLLRNRAEYDHHDTAAVGRRGASIVQVHRLGMRMGLVQFARMGLLYGFNAANGEGLLNANGATQMNLPADSFGDTTFSTYDNGQFAFLIMQIVGNIKARTNNLGIGRKFVIIGPQQDLELFEYNVVQLTQAQRAGAGTMSSAETIKTTLMANGDEMIWGYDDTLIGKGTGGTDAILIVMPEVEKPVANETWNTNEISKISPGLDACTLQLCDMAAPRELPAPLPAGAIDITSEIRMTSGWAIRPESITVLSGAH